MSIALLFVLLVTGPCSAATGDGSVRSGASKWADGKTSRKTQVANFCAALIAIGIFGGVLTKDPSKSRWLSSSATLCMTLAGKFIHEILSRVWCRAFPQWHIGRELGDSDDYHAKIRSKAYRAKLFLTGEHAKWKYGVISFVTQTVDHLMMDPTMSADRMITLDESRIFFDHPTIPVVHASTFLLCKPSHHFIIRPA